MKTAVLWLTIGLLGGVLLVSSLGDINDASGVPPGRRTAGGSGMSTGAVDTLFTFTTSTSGVLITNPDAACNVGLTTRSGTAVPVPMTANSALWIPGDFETVFVNKTTTQKVGVYGTRSN